MASRDRPALEALRNFLQVGTVYDVPAHHEHWQPLSTYAVGSRLAHRSATIPFAEEFLLPSAKRLQFEEWRDEFLAYERAHPSRWGGGRSLCSEPGCEKPVRGRGLCRSHYYRATGY